MCLNQYSTLMINIKNSFGKGSGSKKLKTNVQEKVLVIDYTIDISKHNPLAGSSYIKSLKELDHSREGLINIQSIDYNECFKWSIIRYLNPAHHHPARITKAYKEA